MARIILAKPLCIFTTAGDKTTAKDYDINEVSQAVSTLYSHANDNNKTFLLYIHGRAKVSEDSEVDDGEPYKSINEVIPVLEQGPVRVLMLWWPGDSGTFSFPSDKARIAAGNLSSLLSQLIVLKKNGILAQKKMVFITHSMGSIVLEEFLLNHYNNSFNYKLFDNVILSASASKSKDHSDWLKKLDFARNIFVMINPNDRLLLALVLELGGLLPASALGRKLKRDYVNKSAFKYVNLDKLGFNNHRYFIGNINPNLTTFFQQVYRGEDVTFDNAHFVLDDHQYFMKNNNSRL